MVCTYIIIKEAALLRKQREANQLHADDARCYDMNKRLSNVDRMMRSIYKAIQGREDI